MKRLTLPLLLFSFLAYPAAAQLTFDRLATANAPAVFLEFTGISGFRYYEVRCSGLITADDGRSMFAQFGTGAGPAWQTAGYNENGAADEPYVYFTSNSGSIAPDWPASAQLDTQALDDPTIHKTLRFTSEVFYPFNGDFYTNPQQGNGSLNANTLPITALRIGADGTSFTSGECSLFGIIDPPAAKKRK